MNDASDADDEKEEKDADRFTEASQKSLRSALIAAQAKTAREAREQAGREEEAEKAEALKEQLKAQAKREPPKESPRLRLDKAAGHPVALCKDKEKSRKRAAAFQRLPGKAERAEQRLTRESQWHEGHDKPGTRKYICNPRAPASGEQVACLMNHIEGKAFRARG